MGSSSAYFSTSKTWPDARLQLPQFLCDPLQQVFFLLLSLFFSLECGHLFFPPPSSLPLFSTKCHCSTRACSELMKHEHSERKPREDRPMSPASGRLREPGGGTVSSMQTSAPPPSVWATEQTHAWPRAVCPPPSACHELPLLVLARHRYILDRHRPTRRSLLSLLAPP